MYGSFLIRDSKAIFTQRQRLSALFFVVVFACSVLVPVGQAAAEAQQRDRSEKTAPALLPEAAKDKIKCKDPNANRPMKQNYADALPVKEASSKVAADYRQPAIKLPGGLGDLKDRVPTVASAAGLRPAGVTAAADQAVGSEITEKRTASSMTFRKGEGKQVVRQFTSPQFYKKDGKWADIDLNLIEDKDSADAGNILGRGFGAARSLLTSPNAYVASGNGWLARFAPSGSKQDMVRIKMGDQQIGFSPIGAKDGVTPVITNDAEGRQTVHFYDLWPGVKDANF